MNCMESTEQSYNKLVFTTSSVFRPRRLYSRPDLANISRSSLSNYMNKIQAILKITMHIALNAFKNMWIHTKFCLATRTRIVSLKVCVTIRSQNRNINTLIKSIHNNQSQCTEKSRPTCREHAKRKQYTKILTLAQTVKPCKRNKLTDVCTVHKHVVLRWNSIYNRAIRVKCFNHLRQFRGVWVNVQSMFLTWQLEMFESIPFGTVWTALRWQKCNFLHFQRDWKPSFSICTRTHEADPHVRVSPPQQRSIYICLIKPLIVARFGGFLTGSCARVRRSWAAWIEEQA